MARTGSSSSTSCSMSTVRKRSCCRLMGSILGRCGRNSVSAMGEASYFLRRSVDGNVRKLLWKSPGPFFHSFSPFSRRVSAVPFSPGPLMALLLVCRRVYKGFSSMKDQSIEGTAHKANFAWFIVLIDHKGDAFSTIKGCPPDRCFIFSQGPSGRAISAEVLF